MYLVPNYRDFLTVVYYLFIYGKEIENFKSYWRYSKFFFF